MELIKPKQHIPNDIVKLLLQFDGRIKYRNGQYVDSIDRNDERYVMLDKVTKKKIEIYQSEIEDHIEDESINYDNFIHNVFFENLPNIALTYLYISYSSGESRFYFRFGKKNNKDDIIFFPVANWQFT